MTAGSATIKMKSKTGSPSQSYSSINFMYACYMQIVSPMFYNSVNILECEFLLNNIPACNPGGLELGEGISKFGNKNWGIFHVFGKSVFVATSYIFIVILKCALVL